MAINLKQEIDRTIELKNKSYLKSKLAKLLFGEDETLEEIAGNIEGMVKQF